MSYTQVAVYGSLKKGFGNHRLLERARHLGNGTVDGFVMYSMGGFPMCVKGTGSICVEVYLVNEREFACLDGLEGYPEFYNREVVQADVAGYEPTISAWMYFGTQAQVEGLPLVKSGVWTREETYSYAFGDF